MEVAILCLDQVFDSAFHIVRDVLDAASEMRTNDAGDLRVETVSLDGEPVTTASGQILSPDRAASDVDPRLVVVPGIRAWRGVEPLVSALESPMGRSTVDWLRDHHRRGAEVATACTGAWFVAESGLLDGREATTSWPLAGPFRSRYPQIELRVGKMLTYDNRIRCAGAAMAHMDLALSLVTSYCGTQTSRQIAGKFLLDDRPSQANYMMTHHLQSTNEDFRRIDAWIRAHLAEGFSVRQLATACGLSTRTLARRVLEASGEPPLRYVQRVRVERAIHLLETTTRPFSEITTCAGYEEPATLRRLIRALTGRSPSEIRSRAQVRFGSERRPA